MKLVKLMTLLLCTMTMIGSGLYADDPIDGKSLFAIRCAGCHNVNKVLTGPALAGVSERHSFAWIVQFVNSSQNLVRKGDKDAVAVYEKFNRIVMPDHPDITEQQVLLILDYIKDETRAVAEKPPFSKPGRLRPAYLPVTDSWFYISYTAMVLVLAGVMILLVKVKELQRKTDKTHMTGSQGS